MTAPNDVEDLIEGLDSPAMRTPALVDQYDTLCIRFHREFFGNH